MKHLNRKPLPMFGMLIMAGIMIGVMIMIMMLFYQVGEMGKYMFGISMFGMMIIPLIGLLLMIPMMYFVYRKMTGRSGPMSMMGGDTQEALQQNKDKNLITLKYHIPAVNCDHCKATIESEVSKLPGVDSVDVDVDSRQAVIRIITPPTNTEIEDLLATIGYSPASQ